MEEKKKGGKRVGAGRKPINISEKKRLITLYVPDIDVWKFGSIENIKTKVYEFIGSYENKDLEFKPMTPVIERELISHFANKSSVQEKSFQEHMNEIGELEYEAEYKKKAIEIEAATNLSVREKNLLLLNMKKTDL